MGDVYSKPAANNSNIPFLILSFYYDQMHLVNADVSVINLVRNCLQIHYPKGIQKEKQFDHVVVFKLQGYPFSPLSSSIDHRNFLNFACVLLKELSQAGYIKIMSGDVNWYIDLSAWFFYRSPSTVANDIEFCAVDLWGWDKLKLFNCPPGISDAIKYVVFENWKGIQKAAYEEECFTLKLKGYPWQSPGGEDGVRNRIMIMKILQVMGSYGWTLYSATNIDAMTDTLFFCRKRNLYISPSFTSSIFALSLNHNDKLRLMNADDVVREIIRSVLTDHWPAIQNEGSHFGSHEFKLKGYPWWCRGISGLPSVNLFCQILTALRRAGWKAIMNLDISRSPNDKGVFFFVRMPPKDAYYTALSVKERNHLYALHMNEQIISRLSEVISWFFDMKRPPALVSHTGVSATKWSLKGSPWSSIGQSAERFNGQLMIAGLVNAMVAFNYHLCSSTDISSVYVHKDKPPNFKPDGDTLFFASDDPPLNVGLFTDQPNYAPPPDFFSASAPPPPPSYEIFFAN